MRRGVLEIAGASCISAIDKDGFMSDDELSATEAVCKNAQPGTLAWWMRDWVLPLIAGVRERDAALRAAQERVAELEALGAAADDFYAGWVSGGGEGARSALLDAAREYARKRDKQVQP